MRETVVSLILWVLSITQVVATERPSLSGKWTCRGPCQIPNSLTRIEQFGSNVTCTNERGQKWQGSIALDRTISCWGLRGRLLEDNHVIDWGDGKRWIR